MYLADNIDFIIFLLSLEKTGIFNGEEKEENLISFKLVRWISVS